MKRFYLAAVAAAMALGLAGAPGSASAAPTSTAVIGLERPAAAPAGEVVQAHYRRHRRHRGVFLYFGVPRHFYRHRHYHHRRHYRHRHYHHRRYHHHRHWRFRHW